MNFIESLTKQFNIYVQETYNISADILSQISFSLNIDEQKQQFGDISTNAALVLARPLKKSPMKIAEELLKFFIFPEISLIQVAQPGFINITLSHDILMQELIQLITDQTAFFKPSHLDQKHFSLEFVSANPTGPLHLGHGRGGIIGDVLANILLFLGHRVTREYYINDAGLQIAKLGMSFKIRCQQSLDQDVTLPEEAYHGNYLIALAKQCIKQYGMSLLEQPDSFFTEYAKNAMLADIKKTLENYGIQFDLWFSEKTLHEDGSIEKALAILTQRNTTYNADGAIWFKSHAYGDDKDRVLVKSNGEMTYIAADVAYTENKFQRANHLILVLGQDHHSYVVRLKGIAQALGHHAQDLDVILYQLITLNEKGEQIRMSKRAGTMVNLQEVIDMVGKDVARFFFLHRKADAHLDFDIDLALKKTEENPVYYIQYAYVRTRSILSRIQEQSANLHNALGDTIQLDILEKLIIKKMMYLKELLLAISKHYQTHLLTYYTLELAQLFHRYYATHRVLDADNKHLMNHRLQFIKAFQKSFELCLNLLGISKPYSM